MKKVFNSDQRHMIPRWSSLEIAFEQHELSSNTTVTPEKVNSLKESQRQYYDQCLNVWNNEKSIPAAVELITQASMLEIECQDAIDYIRSKIIMNEFIPVAVKELIGTFDEKPVINSKEAIRNLRKKLIESPKDSLLWSELARNYLIAGELEKSEKALFNAYYLSPNNRYILRNLSRFFIHKDDCEQALYYVRKSPLIKNDPWILSTEIALSNLCERTSKNIKIARNIIENDNYSSESISELASELGTMEYYSSNKKGGKKNLLIAKKAINENSAAQIQWIHNEVNKLDEEILKFKSPINNFEGELYKQLNNTYCDWENVLNLSNLWFKYQPFSADPILWGSVIAVDMLDDAPTAIQLLQIGLSCNKEDPSLINNLAYSFLQNNNVGEAKKLLDIVDETTLELTDKIMLTATKGLLNYRIGDPTTGAALYKEAIENAKKNNLQHLYTKALLYNAKEAMKQKEDISNIVTLLKKCDLNNDAFIRDFVKKYDIFSNQ